MSRTTRRKNNPHRYQYTRDWVWHSAADGSRTLYPVLDDDCCAYTARKLRELHGDCGSRGRWGIPRFYRRPLNRQVRVRFRSQFARAVRCDELDEFVHDSRARDSMYWN